MPAETFEARLSGYRDATLAGLLSAVPQREPLRHLYGPLTAYLSRSGKGIRPALCLATCRAFGGDDGEAVADLRIDPAARSVRRGAREIDLTRREFELLEVFARNAGIVLARDRLLELVWGYDWAADGNVVDVFVSYLRRKLEAGGEPRLIQTVRGVGFVLREAQT